MKFDELSNRIIGLTIEVHKGLGPGLLENTYKQCLAYELRQAGINFQMESELYLYNTRRYVSLVDTV